MQKIKKTLKKSPSFNSMQASSHYQSCNNSQNISEIDIVKSEKAMKTFYRNRMAEISKSSACLLTKMRSRKVLLKTGSKDKIETSQPIFAMGKKKNNKWTNIFFLYSPTFTLHLFFLCAFVIIHIFNGFFYWKFISRVTYSCVISVLQTVIIIF